jgi:hypothetical protein
VREGSDWAQPRDVEATIAEILTERPLSDRGWVLSAAKYRNQCLVKELLCFLVQDTRYRRTCEDCSRKPQKIQEACSRLSDLLQGLLQFGLMCVRWFVVHLWFAQMSLYQKGGVGFVEVEHCDHNPDAIHEKQAVMGGGYLWVDANQENLCAKTNFCSVAAEAKTSVVWWECCVLLKAGTTIEDSLKQLKTFCAVPKIEVAL